ncbi:hypothetical protein ACKWTF_011661 [Chironomus riparius]
MSDFSSILPNNQQVLERDDKWRKLFEKYENCGDCEDDGYDVVDLIACGEVEDEELDDIFDVEDEALESSSESDDFKENNNRDLVVYNNKPKTLQDLEKIYDPDFIQGLKRAFNKRCAELDGMNLLFWKRSKTQEGFNESNIKTPNFEASSMSFFRSSEQVCQSGKKSQQLSPQPFKMPHPVNFNRDNLQFGNFAQNMASANQRFPLQINDLMNGSQKINIRIREMHYDLSVDGRDITEFFIPNCNSTYQNAIPALGNSLIDNTISNAVNLQNTEMNRPAIMYNVEKIRTESPKKVVETPELNLSNIESLNSSVIDTFEGINISSSSRDENTSKGKKTSKRNARKKRAKKTKQKSKVKDVKHENNLKSIAPVDSVVSISEKLELSYSDVVKLSPKNNLKQTKSSKPVNDSKKPIDQQKNKRGSQEKKTEEMAKNYRRIIDPDTSTEEIFEKQEVTKTKSQKSKFVNGIENSAQTLENNKIKDSKRMKEKPEMSSKPKGSEKLPKKDEKSMEVTKNLKPKNDQVGKQTSKVEVTKSEVVLKTTNNQANKQKIQQKSKVEVSSNDQVKAEKQKVYQKSKQSVKVNENKKEQPQPQKSSSATTIIKKIDSKTKELSCSKKENESQLQYDKNGVPFRNIGGFIVHYEENDSDSESTEDDTEFFRRIHAEIRQKKSSKH